MNHTKISLGRGIIGITEPLEITIIRAIDYLSQNQKILDWAKKYDPDLF